MFNLQGLDLHDENDAKLEDAIEWDGRTAVQVKRHEDLERSAIRKFDYFLMPLITMFCG